MVNYWWISPVWWIAFRRWLMINNLLFASFVNLRYFTGNHFCIELFRKIWHLPHLETASDVTFSTSFFCKWFFKEKLFLAFGWVFFWFLKHENLFVLFTFLARCSFRGGKNLTRRYSLSPSYRRPEDLNMTLERGSSLVSTPSAPARMPVESEVLEAFEDVLVRFSVFYFFHFTSFEQLLYCELFKRTSVFWSVLKVLY